MIPAWVARQAPDSDPCNAQGLHQDTCVAIYIEYKEYTQNSLTYKERESIIPCLNIMILRVWIINIVR